MNRRASLAFALCLFSIAALADVPNGSDDFTNINTSRPNWVTLDPSGPLEVGGGLLRLRVPQGDTGVDIGGWQWAQYLPGNGNWSFEAVISTPTGVLTSADDFLILGLQLHGTIPDSSNPGLFLGTTISDYIQLTLDTNKNSIREPIAVVANDGGQTTTFPDLNNTKVNARSAVRFDFQLTDASTGRGTLSAQFSVDGSQSWTTLTSLADFSLDPNPSIFVFSQSQLLSGNGIDPDSGPSANAGIDSVRAVPEPSTYAFALAALATMAWLSAVRVRRFLQARAQQ